MTRSRSRSRRQVRAILAELEKSGLSQRAFAERRNLSPSTLAYWIRRERQDSGEPSGSLALVHVGSSEEDPSSPFLLVTDSVRIEVPRDVTAEEWRRLREAWSA